MNEEKGVSNKDMLGMILLSCIVGIGAFFLLLFAVMNHYEKKEQLDILENVIVKGVGVGDSSGY